MDSSFTWFPRGEERLVFAPIAGRSEQDPLELLQRVPQLETPGVNLVFADRILVPAGAFLYHRDRAPDPPVRLEISQHDDCVGKKGQVNRRMHLSEEPMLRQRHKRVHSLTAEILEKFVQMKQQGRLIRHRQHVAVEAVDHHGPSAAFGCLRRQPASELARGECGDVDLLQV